MWVSAGANSELNYFNKRAGIQSGPVDFCTSRLSSSCLTQSTLILIGGMDGKGTSSKPGYSSHDLAVKTEQK